jgi:hypothetical protein
MWFSLRWLATRDFYSDTPSVRLLLLSPAALTDPLARTAQLVNWR